MNKKDVDQITKAIFTKATQLSQGSATNSAMVTEPKVMQAIVKKIDNGFLVTPGGGIGYNSREIYIKELSDVPEVLKKVLA